VKNIILLLIFISASVKADTVGIDMNSWVDQSEENSITPMESTNTQTIQEFPTQSDSTFSPSQQIDEPSDEIYVVPSAQEDLDQIPMATTLKPKTKNSIEPSVVKEIISESKNDQVIESTPIATPISNKTASKKVKINSILDDVINFFMPIVEFAKNSLAQFLTLIGVVGALFYLIFAPFLRGVKGAQYSEDIDVSSHVAKKVQERDISKVLDSDENILTQAQFSTLKGLLNESFIYAKEEVLLSGNLLQDEKNRELVMLDWKYNQILNFSLPKLDTNSSKVFTQGAKELLDEKESREIMTVALKDILKEAKITEEDRNFLQSILDKREELQTNATLKYKDDDLGRNYLVS
jgi:hypothetical protein